MTRKPLKKQTIEYTLCAVRYGVLGRFGQQGTPRTRVPPLFSDWLKCTPQHRDWPVAHVPHGFQGFSVPLMGLHFEGGLPVLEFVPPLLDGGGLAEIFSA